MEEIQEKLIEAHVKRISLSLGLSEEDEETLYEELKYFVYKLSLLN